MSENLNRKTPDTPAGRRPWIRFDRNELAGSFGDIGTDLPLIIMMVLAAGLDSASVFAVYGLMQIGMGLLYGLPMPIQPLKLMAVIVITKRVAPGVLYGGGLAIGVIMLVLALTGALSWVARVVPRCVVRGIQAGLGLSLGTLALGTYVPSMGAAGYALAGAGFVIIVVLWGNRRWPAALFVIALGVIYAAVFRLDGVKMLSGVGLALPKPHLPQLADVWTGLLVLALPQLPLSLSNSVIATEHTLRDLYPERRIGVRRIGLTYAAMNLIAPFVSGIPVCHGCGGLVGHYAFGGRTGGSVVIYGTMYLVIGLFLSRVFTSVVEVFPQPILGVVLLFEGVGLLLLMRDVAGSKRDLTVTLLVALMAIALPQQGYVVGLLLGTALFYLSERFRVLRGPEAE